MNELLEQNFVFSVVFCSYASISLRFVTVCSILLIGWLSKWFFKPIFSILGPEFFLVNENSEL